MLPRAFLLESPTVLIESRGIYSEKVQTVTVKTIGDCSYR